MAEKQTEKTALKEVIAVRYITKDNARLEKNGDFIRLTVTLPDDEGNSEEKTYDRIFLHRAFPFDYPYAYISVLDADSKEIGIIQDVDAMGEENARLLREELDRKYYTPVIRQILSVKDKFGYSYWKVKTDEGELDFTCRDTFSSLLKVGGTRIFVNDIDGNRYEIPDLEALDHKSFKKIELFL
ncbi:MAG: DUF1854 domain-containing protein [Ruminococcaceae bacterium]|jgi:hypothetical protein|nr:DUF1854 domain-containing protein [Oscillospiraceae bacterium]